MHGGTKFVMNTQIAMRPNPLMPKAKGKTNLIILKKNKNENKNNYPF